MKLTKDTQADGYVLRLAMGYRPPEPNNGIVNIVDSKGTKWRYAVVLKRKCPTRCEDLTALL
jgi:hypothetical protein